MLHQSILYLAHYLQRVLARPLPDISTEYESRGSRRERNLNPR
jgi:hypothetical protein